MKDYFDIYIHPPGKTAEAVRKHIITFSNQSNNWNYDTKESELRSNDMGSIDCVVNLLKNSKSEIKLFFAKHWSRKGMYLVNIVPKNSSLSMEEYNSIALNFYNDFKKYASNKNLNFKLTKKGENLTLEDIITGKKTRETFERYLNHFPTSFHPLDTQRLDLFISALHRFGSTIDLELLNRYLGEELNWDAKDADKCINRIYIGCKILETNRRFHFYY